MNIAEVAARAVTYAAAACLFGASVFAIYAPVSVAGDAHADCPHGRRSPRRHLWRVQIACAAAPVAAGLLWLVIHAAVVAGVTFEQAASGAATGRILRETLFGRALALHLGLAALLTA